MVSGKNSGGEKWRKSWTHSPRHPPQQHLSPLAASSDDGAHFHCNHNVFTRFGRTQRTAPPSQGGQWGARWGTPGSKVGSTVGNPREQGGEHCEGTPSGSHNTTLKKTKDLQNGHTRESLTPERKLPSTSSTLHISLVKHSTGSTIVDTHQARTETPTTTKHHTIRAQLCTPNAS